MKLNIEIDEKHTEPSITIKTNEWTEELEEIVAIIKGKNRERIFGDESSKRFSSSRPRLILCMRKTRKTFARIGKRNIEVRMKLYEVEEMLAPYGFMRFSKSVIGNLNQIERFELSFNGNLCVYFHSGNKEYISRKYVASIKKQLAMGGQSDDD